MAQKKEKLTQQQADAANEFVKEANTEPKESEEWVEDSGFFEYRKLESGEEITGEYLDTINDPFDLVRLRCQEGEFTTIYGIPLYYSLQNFFDRYEVSTGAQLRIVNTGLVDIGNGRTMNKIRIYFKKNDPHVRAVSTEDI